MRFTFARVAAAALLVPMAASCSSQRYPASPVPAVLQPAEAVYLADEFLDQRDAPPRTVTKIERQEWGYLVGYETAFDPAAADPLPPKQSRLLAVRNDGGVREWTFRRGR